MKLKFMGEKVKEEGNSGPNQCGISKSFIMLEFGIKIWV